MNLDNDRRLAMNLAKAIGAPKTQATLANKDACFEHISPEHLEAATRQALERGLVRRSALKTALKKTDLPKLPREVFQPVLEWA